MTKRHFEALAVALKESKPVDGKDYPDTHDGRHAFLAHLFQWRADVRAIAVAGMPTAPTSDKGKFLARFEEACGYETTEPEAKELKS